jgi:hypothetical protein
MSAPARIPLATIAGDSSCERIEVALRQGVDGDLSIELLQQHYGEGIGWFNQRSLTIDPRQWKQIQSILGSHDVAGVVAEAADAPRDVLPFPVPSDGARRRSAAGAR